MGQLYELWKRKHPNTVEAFKTDIEKLPEIPNSNNTRTGIVKKFKDKMEAVHNRQKEILNKLKEKHGKGR